jgi:hypothetical protein
VVVVVVVGNDMAVVVVVLAPFFSCLVLGNDVVLAMADCLIVLALCWLWLWCCGPNLHH